MSFLSVINLMNFNSELIDLLLNNFFNLIQKGDHQLQIASDGVYLLIFFMSITGNDNTFNASGN